MAKRRHTEDSVLYQQLLESTRDSDGVEHRDLALKLLIERLAEDKERIAEYAQARASEVADGFAASRKPETDNGQMTLDIDTYLVIGDNELVRAENAMAVHTRQWLDVGARNFAVVAAAWSAKDLRGRALLAVQDERGCSILAADEILNGGKDGAE